MRFVLFLFVTLVQLGRARAEEIQIFDMRKTLAMSNADTVYRDFYLTKGSEAGLRPGMILTVKRRTPFYDSIHNRSAGDLNVSVARIKVVHVERDLAVARQHSVFSREELPLLEDNFIMIGDIVDLSSATTEGKLKGGNPKKASASEESSASETPKEAAVNPPPAQPAVPATETVAAKQFSVDFASQSPDNSKAAPPVEGPVIQ